MHDTIKAIRFYSLVGGINLLVGIAFLSLYIPRPAEVQPLLSHYTAPIRSVKIQQRQAVHGIPTRVSVPRLAIDVKVDKGSYNAKSDSWTLDNDRAFYADISVPANDSNGTTLIYGHARASVFYPLLQVHEGAEAIVYTDTGAVFHYTYQSKQEVDPSDLSLLRVSGAPVLILQTCSGPWDAYRTMVTFTLTSVGRA